ncbi:MAG: AarF/ABC1/UbiB kinase family protein [Candidatus Nomurabacteria bacterium]|jgi:tRNA A-37 threonylcarbamoyl transferase component Bud32|nr:AarF/ABC1/UbiB kinase family protein [Candidatus Nomurabacteria bacterium]
MKSLLELVYKLLKIKFSRTPNQNTRMKKILFYHLQMLGGVYVKFLQALCNNYNFTKGWVGPTELAVFKNVSLENIDVAEHVSLDNFLWLEQAPFASGSFAQVYKGQLRTGELVAVKILRPSVKRTIRRDIKLIKIISRIMRRFLPIDIVDIKAAADEFCNACRLEIDYRREINNLEFFYEMYKNRDEVVIPKVYKLLSSASVITQDFIAGQTLADVLTLKKHHQNSAELVLETTGSDLWAQMAILGAELCHMAMQEECVFADPHPGNVILLPKNRIALIDFGIVSSPPTSRKAFYDWVFEYHRNLNGNKDVDKLMIATLRCFSPALAQAFANYQAFNGQSVLEVLGDTFNDRMGSFGENSLANELFVGGHLFQLYYKVLDKNNALGLKLDINNFQLLKAIQTYLSMIYILDREGDGTSFAKCLNLSMENALSRVGAFGIADDSEIEVSLPESYAILSDALSSLAERDEFLFNKLLGRI